ncbi:S8 family peptidase [Paenibacillus validus]|uniref:S8 family serine peptidase n=1 Tax=Paenibacillus validus TaxID=44253 RepID=A0A7X2ZD81_9BACL|nr:S8 family peptidase [Paenibacillus validus]MUG72810.1 S8 family serine peptidase [Paenibacillus validus]
MTQERPHFVIAKDNIHVRDTDFDGGGSTYRRNDYYSHGQTLIQGIKSVQQRMRTSSDYFKDRSFLEIRLASEEKLKERYKNLLLNSRITILDLVNESVGYAAIKAEDIALLESRLKEYSETENHVGKSYFSFIEEIRPVPVQNRISANLRKVIEERPTDYVKVSIESFSSLPSEAREYGILNQIDSFMKQNQGELTGSYIHSTGNVVIEGKVMASIAQTMVEDFDSIRNIELTSKLFLPRVESLSDNFPEVKIKPLEGNAAVCIFDSGTTSNNDLLNEYIIDRIQAINSHGANKYHGTFVASRIIFRDKLLDQLARGELTPFAKVLDVRVFGTDQNGDDIGLDESDLVKLVRKTVHNFHRNIRVYNLSLGFVNPITDETALDDSQVSRLAAELDNLSKTYDVIFVVSSGNINSLYNKLGNVPYPQHFSEDSTRILPPGESFLNITVGSIATNFQIGALAELNHPSPFSRRGPGFAGTRKPDIVCDGGNVTTSGHRDVRIAASALGENTGDIAYDVGTSFAAPIISSYAAELFDRIPDASSNLVKAQLIHFSTIPTEMSTFNRPNKFEHLGFGEPNLSLCLESLKSKASYIFEGSIAQQKYVKIPFWVPSILASDASRNNRKKLKVRATIVWNPPTDRRKFTEYSLVHLWPNLFKVGANGNEEMLQLTGLEECSYREKFCPVIRIEKQFERSFSGGLWSFQLRMSTRWDVPEDYEQDFAIIVSVEDPDDTLDVYGEIINEVGIRYQTLSRVSR